MLIGLNSLAAIALLLLVTPLPSGAFSWSSQQRHIEMARARSPSRLGCICSSSRRHDPNCCQEQISQRSALFLCRRLKSRARLPLTLRAASVVVIKLWMQIALNAMSSRRTNHPDSFAVATGPSGGKGALFKTHRHEMLQQHDSILATDLKGAKIAYTLTTI